MNIDQFWELIEKTLLSSGGDSGTQAEELQHLLVRLGKKEIVAFENILNERISALSRFDVLAANFMIQSYVSDDVFTDFRAWLVSQGKDRYEGALQNVESIAEWLDRAAVDDIDGSDFVTLAVTAYEEIGGTEDEFYDAVKFPDESDFEQAWPEDRPGFEKKLPNLYRKFWNQERIEELHADG